MQLKDCVLPPCHCMAQFRVLNGNQLHCHMYQRSADYTLGVPYNIASYATLTHILARLSGTIATSLTVSFGDVHVYEPHWQAARMQLKRDPYDPPRLHVNLPTYDWSKVNTPAVAVGLADVTFDCLSLVGYKHHPLILYEMVP